MWIKCCSVQWSNLFWICWRTMHCIARRNLLHLLHCIQWTHPSFLFLLCLCPPSASCLFGFALINHPLGRPTHFRPPWFGCFPDWSTLSPFIFPRPIIRKIWLHKVAPVIGNPWDWHLKYLDPNPFYHPLCAFPKIRGSAASLIGIASLSSVAATAVATAVVAEYLLIQMGWNPCQSL